MVQVVQLVGDRMTTSTAEVWMHARIATVPHVPFVIVLPWICLATQAAKVLRWVAFVD